MQDSEPSYPDPRLRFTRSRSASAGVRVSEQLTYPSAARDRDFGCRGPSYCLLPRNSSKALPYGRRNLYNSLFYLMNENRNCAEISMGIDIDGNNWYDIPCEAERDPGSGWGIHAICETDQYIPDKKF